MRYPLLQLLGQLGTWEVGRNFIVAVVCTCWIVLYALHLPTYYIYWIYWIYWTYINVPTAT